MRILPGTLTLFRDKGLFFYLYDKDGINAKIMMYVIPRQEFRLCSAECKMMPEKEIELA